MARFWIALLCVFVPLSVTSAQGMDEKARQRMSVVSSHIKQTAQAEGSTLVQGSVRLFVFGPEATVGFYTLEEAGGTQQQRMLVVETQTDTARGEAAPPISGPHVTLKRYHSKQVVVGDARVGGKGRTLDVGQARIQEERSATGFHLLATVTVPIAGTSRMATFKISRPLKAEKASITEASQ